MFTVLNRGDNGSFGVSIGVTPPGMYCALDKSLGVFAKLIGIIGTLGRAGEASTHGHCHCIATDAATSGVPRKCDGLIASPE